MKTKLFHISIALLLIAAGCAREIVPVTEPDSHIVSFRAGQEGVSRTSVVEGSDSASYLWSAYDASRIHLYENGTAASQVTASFSPDMRYAYISATFPSAAPDSPTYTGFVNGATGNTPVVPSSQTIGTESYDPSADIIIAKPLEGRPSDGVFNLSFHRAVAVTKMTLHGLAASEKVRSVKVISDQALSGTY
ncbi:MAG: hypothetical protein IKX03_01715, partial [Bacteroidales bacterium]|nr:hypothetical protein [Bacteroidales bacterium]